MGMMDSNNISNDLEVRKPEEKKNYKLYCIICLKNLQLTHTPTNIISICSIIKKTHLRMEKYHVKHIKVERLGNQKKESRRLDLVEAWARLCEYIL